VKDDVNTMEKKDERSCMKDKGETSNVCTIEYPDMKVFEYAGVHEWIESGNRVLEPDSICDKNDPNSDEEHSEFHSCTEFDDDLTNVEIDKREIARLTPHDKVNTSKPDPEGIKIEIKRVRASSTEGNELVHHDGRKPPTGKSI
jgi:hypothetical protein